jgi:hypothetical protein
MRQKDYLDKFKDVTNARIFGNTRYEYAFISEQHPDMVEWDQSKILIAVVDIEVGSENGFLIHMMQTNRSQPLQ